MKRNISLVVLTLLLFPICRAQNPQEVLLSVTDLLQYERAKQKGGEPSSPFRRYDMKRIRASKVLEDGDKRHIWGYHVHANLEYDKSSEPLYKLFKRGNMGSLAVIDDFTDGHRQCDVIFWGKRYYRRFSHDLRRMGFSLRNSQSQSNVLEFRKEGVSIGVDMIIWPEVYIMQVKAISNS